MLEEAPWLLALLIFVARVVDVSLGTVRTILVIRGHRFFAAAIGFFEILVWIVAVSQVIQNLDSWYLALAYAAGFATGNVVGMWVEGKLAIGQELVRVISQSADVELAVLLREAGLDVLELEGHGEAGRPVEVLFVVAPRRRIPEVLRRIGQADPAAVCTLSDVKRHASMTPTAARVALARQGRGGLFKMK